MARSSDSGPASPFGTRTPIRMSTAGGAACGNPGTHRGGALGWRATTAIAGRWVRTNAVRTAGKRSGSISRIAASAPAIAASSTGREWHRRTGARPRCGWHDPGAAGRSPATG
jgi:hypothetical protein